MDFTLLEEQAMLQDSIHRWCRDNYNFETRRAIITGGEENCPECWRAFAEMGWLSIPFDEVDGGFGGGPVEMMLLMEQLGAAIVVEPFLATVVMAGGVLRRTTGQQQRTLIPKIIAGELQMALAFVETQAGYDLADVTTTADSVADGYCLNGEKAIVLNAQSADYLVVPARTCGLQTDREGITLFLVNADVEGIEIDTYRTQDGFLAADVSLKEVKVGSDAVLGIPGQGLEVLEAVIDDAAFAVSAEAVGVMDFLLEATVEYAKTRKQFGVPIGSFQALQFRMADMFNEYQQARSIVLSVCAEAGTNSEQLPTKAVAACKAYIGVAGKYVGETAIQIHGAVGVTDELDVSHYFKRLTMINTLFGDKDYQVQRFAA